MATTTKKTAKKPAAKAIQAKKEPESTVLYTAGMICGIIGFVFSFIPSIIGIVFSFIPGVNWIGFFLGILASDKARSFKFTIKALDEDGVSLGEDTLDVKSLAPSESKSVLIFKSSNLSNGTLEDANYVVSKSSTY